MLSTFEKIVLCAAAVAIILGGVLANMAADTNGDDPTADLYGAFMHEHTRPRKHQRYSTVTIEEID